MSKNDEKLNLKRYSGPVFKTFTWALFIFLILYVLFLLTLMYFGLLTSLKSNRDFSNDHNVIGFPNMEYKTSKEYLLLRNYKEIVKNFTVPYTRNAYFLGDTLKEAVTIEVTFPKMLINSFFYVVGGGICWVVGKFIVGYMCAMYKNPVSKFIYMLVIITMIIPIVGTTPAMLTLMRNIGLYDTFVGNYIQKLSFDGMYFLIFFEFFRGMSSSYQEAAEIDGASQLRVMLLIYFPLGAKMFGTVFLIQAITLWNDYNTVLLYLPSWPTLTYGVYLATFKGDQSRYPTPMRISATMILAVPTMILFFIFKDRIMGNLSLGGLKE